MGEPPCWADGYFPLGGDSRVPGWKPSLTSQLLLLQLFAMIFAMCLFRGIQ